ncbi:MAG: phytoene/squalene synthase family protein [Planctomycetota bacterium]|nr:phytoene/squalene synthase family protein [Planctomycetota bacterium]
MTIGEATPLGTMPLETAFERCSDDVRSRARNFWYGLRLLPPEQFHSLCAIYSWMRLADDLADAEDGGGSDDRRRDLQGFHDRTLELFSGRMPPVELAPEAHIFPALLRVLELHDLDPVDFRLMIEGQFADLEPRTIETRDQLLEYCDQVASTVGRVCVRIWGGTGSECLQLATERGKALQLTNILRDVREDHHRHRCYLPAEEFRSAGLTREDLVNWSDPERCRTFIRNQVETAEGHYRAAEGLESLIEPAARPTCWAMTRIYHALLRKIRNRPALIAGEARIRLSSFRKLSIGMRARLQARREASREPRGGGS